MILPLPPVQTERLILRLVEPPDAAALTGLMTPIISRWVAVWPSPITPEIVDGIIADALASAAAGLCLPTVIVNRSDDKIIGWLKLDIAPDNPSTAELGYWIGEASQRKGFACEAAAATIRAAFRTLNISAIEAGAQLENTASHNMLNKLGMHQVGTRTMFAPAPARRVGSVLANRASCRLEYLPSGCPCRNTTRILST